MVEVAILGAGRLAEAVTRVLASRGARLRVWARRKDAREEFAARHRGNLARDVVSGELGEMAAPAELVVFAVPAPAIAEVAHLFGEVARGDQLVLHACRGVGPNFRLPHQMIRDRTAVRKIGALGGPLHAQELGSGRTLAAVLASRFDEVIEAIARLTKDTPIRVHPSRDLVGVEVSGAVSNAAALAAGMADALSLGETARGVLLTHGLADAQRLGVALGASSATFGGLAGVGDLIPRRVSSTDRHHALGARLARGEPLPPGSEGVEGIITTREAMSVAHARRLDLPLLSAIDRVLRGETPARTALERVLESDLDL
jgi:glycerol-3-phosphate dehydrogenase (NAD(P)+)